MINQGYSMCSVEPKPLQNPTQKLPQKPTSNWEIRQYLENNAVKIMEYNAANAQMKTNVPTCITTTTNGILFNGNLGTQYANDFNLQRRMISPNVFLGDLAGRGIGGGLGGGLGGVRGGGGGRGR